MSDASSKGAAASASDPVTILYTNWRGETAVRRIVPRRRHPMVSPNGVMWFGTNDYHKGADGKPEPQWFITAEDVDREPSVMRDFAWSGIKAVGQEAVDAALAAHPPAVPESVRDLADRLRAWSENDPDPDYFLGGDGAVFAAMQMDCRDAARTLLAAQPAGRVDEVGGWHQPAEIPAVGRKHVRLYEDGSGAVLLIRHDGGEIDCEGNEYELHRTLKPGPWAYTPRGYRFWCEDHGDDLVTLPEPGPADAPAPAPAPDSGRGTAAPWRKVLSDLLAEHAKHICLHEETHRGGAIWTICDHCGRKWADDEGGFTPYEEPRAVTAAWALLICEEIDGEA